MTTRIVPLGGHNEDDIGGNSLLLQHGDCRLLVDHGCKFPADRDPTIRYWRPLLDALGAPRDQRPLGLLVTHGHEDHIGAIVNLFGRHPQVEIFAPGYARLLIEARFYELQLRNERRAERTGERLEATTASLITTIKPGTRFGFGPFEIEPIHVTHSTPDSVAYAIKTPDGLVIHTGDWNATENPQGGMPQTDFARFSALGKEKEGVAALFADSTGALSDKAALNDEGVVAQTIREIVANHPRGRIVVAMFTSNADRLNALAKIGLEHGRRICLFGMSVAHHRKAAEMAGRFRIRRDDRVEAEEARDVPRDNLLVVAGGSQGEEESGLRRLANDEDTRLSLRRGDTVIFSSSVIPGNERYVREVTDKLRQRGILVFDRVSHPTIHASGHTDKRGMQKMIETVRPRALVPGHGSRAMLEAHAALGRTCGVMQSEVVMNGDELFLDHGRLTRGGRLPAQFIPVRQHPRTPRR